MKIYNLRRSIRSLLREGTGDKTAAINSLMRIVCEEINEYLTGKVCHMHNLNTKENYAMDPDPAVTREEMMEELHRRHEEAVKNFYEPTPGKRPDWVDEPEYPVYSLESTISHMRDEMEKGNGILDIVRLSDMLMYQERYQKLRSILRASRIEWIRNSCSNETIDLRDIL